MRVTRSLSFLVIATALLFGGSALPARADSGLATLLGGDHNVTSDMLASQRGGSSPSTDANAVANVSNNSVNGITTTGSNGVLNSFNNASGMFTVFQNSGNNVAMQSQTILNVNLQ